MSRPATSNARSRQRQRDLEAVAGSGASVLLTCPDFHLAFADPDTIWSGLWLGPNAKMSVDRPNQQSALWVRFPESYVGVYAQSLLPTQSVRLMRRRCRATVHVHVPIPSPSPAPADALVRLRRSLAATSCPRSRHKGLLLAVDWAKPSRSSSAAQQRARVLVWAPWTRRYARALFLDHHPKTDPDAVSLCLRRLGLVKLAIRYGYVQR